MQLLPTVHGIQTYEVTDDDRHLWVTAEATSGTTSDRFLENLETVSEYAQSAVNDSRLALACDLYSQALAETSLPARFVALVTAIESLVVQERYAEEICNILSPLSEAVKLQLKEASVEDAVIRSISGRISGLGTESINSAFGKIARLHGRSEGYRDLGAAEFALYCYGLRSKLVHDGKTKDALPLADLMQLVSDVIMGEARSNASEINTP